MAKPKHKDCMGCMDAVWVGNDRYYHCDLCDVYFAGQTKELYEVPNPRTEVKFVNERKGNVIITTFEEPINVTSNDSLATYYGIDGAPTKIILERKEKNESVS